MVLSACESGRSPRGGAETWGIAQAFVAAGSAEVLAAVRPVDDALGAVLESALAAEGADVPLAEALHRALPALRARHPDADWWSWRVWVP